MIQLFSKVCNLTDHELITVTCDSLLPVSDTESVAGSIRHSLGRIDNYYISDGYDPCQSPESTQW